MHETFSAFRNHQIELGSMAIVFNIRSNTAVVLSLIGPCFTCDNRNMLNEKNMNPAAIGYQQISLTYGVGFPTRLTALTITEI